MDVYRSGGKLFGGKYLILLYAGMVTASYYEKLRASPWKCLLFLCLALCWWRFERIDRSTLDRKLHFGDGIGSSNLSLALMAVLLAGFLFNLEFLMRKNSFLRKISGGWAWFGSHTLYIFLYHRFFLDFFLLGFSTLDENIWIKRIAYFSVMASGPIAIEYAVRGIKMLYKKKQDCHVPDGQGGREYVSLQFLTGKLAGSVVCSRDAPVTTGEGRTLLTKSLSRVIVCHDVFCAMECIRMLKSRKFPALLPAVLSVMLCPLVLMSCPGR